MSNAQNEKYHVVAIDCGTVCDTCGKRFTRRSKYKVRERWLCTGGCSATTQYLGDALLISRIQTVINAVRKQPSLIMPSKAENAYVPSKDVRLKERQIKHMLTQVGPMFHPIRKLIYENVTDKFLDMKIDLSADISDKLCDMFSEYTPCDEKVLDIPFMKKTISAIIIQPDANIRIRFINGKEIGNEEVSNNG